MKNLKGDDYMIIFLSVLWKFTSLVISSVYIRERLHPKKIVRYQLSIETIFTQYWKISLQL